MSEKGALGRKGLNRGRGEAGEAQERGGENARTGIWTLWAQTEEIFQEAASEPEVVHPYPGRVLV